MKEKHIKSNVQSKQTHRDTIMEEINGGGSWRRGLVWSRKATSEVEAPPFFFLLDSPMEMHLYMLFDVVELFLKVVVVVVRGGGEDYPSLCDYWLGPVPSR